MSSFFLQVTHVDSPTGEAAYLFGPLTYERADQLKQQWEPDHPGSMFHIVASKLVVANTLIAEVQA